MPQITDVLQNINISVEVQILSNADVALHIILAHHWLLSTQSVGIFANMCVP